MSAQNIKIKVKSQPVVVMEAEVARKIRQHSRSSMKAEVCGVLIGTMDNDRTVIEACIAGINAAQGGAHVTFTQDTWEHIYKIKDQQYPDDKIVGWYHSHPGFGVFLSEHDLFIQENFFSSPQQVAWVFDPHTDEEGCFGWIGGKIEKLSGIRTGYSQSVEMNSSHSARDEDELDDESELESQVSIGRENNSRDPVWMIWTSRVLGYLAVLLFGAVLGYEFMGWRVAREVRAMEQELLEYRAAIQQAEPLIRACQEKFMRFSPFQDGAANPASPGAQGQPQTAPQQTSPQRSAPKQTQPPATGKGTNGKH